MTLKKEPLYGGLHFDKAEVADVKIVPIDSPATWRIRITPPIGGEVEDVILVLGYEWEE